MTKKQRQKRKQKRTPQQAARQRMPKGQGAKRPVAQVTAQAAVHTLQAMPSVLPVAGAPAAGYPVSQALLHFLNAEAPGPGADGRAWARYSGTVSIAMTLNGFFGRMAIGELDADVSQAYDTHRNATGGRRGKPLKSTGRNTEKAYLRKALRQFIDDHDLAGSFELPNAQAVKGGASFARFRLKRHHLARLLWAARGRVWDADLGTWAPCPPWDPERPGAIATDPAWKARLCLKRDRAHVARAIIIAAYTASRAICVTRLRWTAGPEDRSHLSMVDVPMLYRLGPDAADGKLAEHPVLLNRRVSAHLRRWRAMDAKAGFVRVIHYRGHKGELANAPTQSFRSIVQDAGLSKGIRFDDLRLSAGAAIAKTPGMVLRSGALLLGIATSYFLQTYGHLAANYQQRIEQAFGRKPGKEKTEKATEAAPEVAKAPKVRSAAKPDRERG